MHQSGSVPSPPPFFSQPFSARCARVPDGSAREEGRRFTGRRTATCPANICLALVAFHLQLGDTMHLLDGEFWRFCPTSRSNSAQDPATTASADGIRAATWLSDVPQRPSDVVGDPCPSVCRRKCTDAGSCPHVAAKSRIRPKPPYNDPKSPYSGDKTPRSTP